MSFSAVAGGEGQKSMTEKKRIIATAKKIRRHAKDTNIRISLPISIKIAKMFLRKGKFRGGFGLKDFVEAGLSPDQARILWLHFLDFYNDPGLETWSLKPQFVKDFFSDCVRKL